MAKRGACGRLLAALFVAAVWLCSPDGAFVAGRPIPSAPQPATTMSAEGKKAGGQREAAAPSAPRPAAKMLNVIYLNKYVAKNAKDLRRAQNILTKIDPYNQASIPAFIEKMSLFNQKLNL
ncbi:unnamed protein product [Polarella glacialis]|uniref:Uncharacterized protein n=1 Tax=Polarella glacialis TaxID=89957 RepID=A0A813KEE4_POLGL|nr:unnamed protein product [Polarella glacialis]